MQNVFVTRKSSDPLSLHMPYNYQSLEKVEKDLEDGHTSVQVTIPEDELLRHMDITNDNLERVRPTPPLIGTLGIDPESGAVCIHSLVRTTDGSTTNWHIVLRDDDTVRRFEVSVPPTIYLRRDEAISLYPAGSIEGKLAAAYAEWCAAYRQSMTETKVRDAVKILLPGVREKGIMEPFVISVLGGLDVIENDGKDNIRPVRY